MEKVRVDIFPTLNNFLPSNLLLFHCVVELLPPPKRVASRAAEPRMTPEEYDSFLRNPPALKATRDVDRIYDWVGRLDNLDPFLGDNAIEYINPPNGYGYRWNAPVVYFVYMTNAPEKRGIKYAYAGFHTDKHCVSRIILNRVYPLKTEVGPLSILRWADAFEEVVYDDSPGFENLDDQIKRLLALGCVALIDLHAEMLFNNANLSNNPLQLFPDLASRITFDLSADDANLALDLKNQVDPDLADESGRIHWFRNNKKAIPEAFKCVHATAKLAADWMQWVTTNLHEIAYNEIDAPNATPVAKDARMIRNRLIKLHQEDNSGGETVITAVRRNLAFSEGRVAAYTLEPNSRNYIYFRRSAAVLRAYIQFLESNSALTGTWTKCNMATTVQVRGTVWRAAKKTKNR